jgi:hypothetical protein
MRFWLLLDRRHLHARHLWIGIKDEPELFCRSFPKIDDIALERDLVIRFRVDIIGLLAGRYKADLKHLFSRGVKVVQAHDAGLCHPGV